LKQGEEAIDKVILELSFMFKLPYLCLKYTPTLRISQVIVMLGTPSSLSTGL